MLAVFNELPKFCAKCGKQQSWDDFDRTDFFAGASMGCLSCGMHYAYLDGTKLLAAAAEGGDIGRYVSIEDVNQ